MPRSRAVGVMGGTFDPIHYGHLVAASEVAAGFDLSEVLFVPAGQPWQKAGRDTADPEHRFLMTVLATAVDDRFRVSRVDIDRAGPTYTVDTLRDLHTALGPDVDLYFITGADAMAQILTWRDHAEVLRLAHLVGVSRPGHPLAAPDQLAAAVSLVEIPALAISSSDIRSRVARGLPVRYLTPDPVERYIAKHGLYSNAARPPSDTRSPSDTGSPSGTRSPSAVEGPP